MNGWYLRVERARVVERALGLCDQLVLIVCVIGLTLPVYVVQVCVYGADLPWWTVLYYLAGLGVFAVAGINRQRAIKKLLGKADEYSALLKSKE